MIPASVPAEVVFVNSHRVTQTLPVHAWDDDGEALVLWHNQLRLARTLEGFKEVRNRSQIVGVVPGGGWMIEYQLKEEGMAFVDPVVAWAIDADGWAQPIDTDETGLAMPLKDSGGDRRIFHPDRQSDIKLPAEADPAGESD